MHIILSSSLLEDYIDTISFKEINCDNGIVRAVLCTIQDDHQYFHFGLYQEHFDNAPTSLDLLKKLAKEECFKNWMQKLISNEINRRY